MQLPHRENAFIPIEKLTKYLLSHSHPVGQSKARFFSQHGFGEDSVEVLRSGLLHVARNGNVARSETKPYGLHYVVDGEILSPSGTMVKIRTVWIIENNSTAPRFVTAFPG
jgi:hypothetical protein